MDIIDVNLSNIDTEHICCCISDKKGETCVSGKKSWLKERFEEGLIFKKLDVRGKVFIEYIPAENAWCPIEAEGYMYINCFWVSGQFKGQGFGGRLLEECVKDAQVKGKKGLVALSSPKKKPFLSDPAFLKHKGFIECDKAEPYFSLLYYPLTKDAAVRPKFRDCCKSASLRDTGIVLYYSNQCPFAEKYAKLLECSANEKVIPFTLIQITSKDHAQNAPTPFTTYSLFISGSFVTNEILTEEKFLRLINDKMI